MAKRKKDWTISVYVPAKSASPLGEARVQPEDSNAEPLKRHSLRPVIPSFGKVEEVDLSKVEEQWDRTLSMLPKLAAKIGQRASGWKLEEIEVGLTLSAKGELLFIAEAGAEASIKFIMRKH